MFMLNTSLNTPLSIVCIYSLYDRLEPRTSAGLNINDFITGIERIAGSGIDRASDVGEAGSDALRPPYSNLA